MRVLCIAGLEPSGRAGLLADLATVRNLGAAPLGVASALTAQGTGTFALAAAPVRIVQQQLRALREVGPIDAVKLGMIPSASMLRAIREVLRDVSAPWIVDPVVRTSRGEPLSSLRAEDYLRIAGPNVVLTPNVPELAWLCGADAAGQVTSDLRTHAHTLIEAGFAAVVVKGGHLKGAPVDHGFAAKDEWILHGRRVRRTVEHRGTGCRFAAALAAGLGAGITLKTATTHAKREVEKFLATPILRRRTHGRQG